MTNLPGNPFAESLDEYADPRNSLEAQATLALAFEMRTANMIAAYNGDLNKRVDGVAAEQYPLHNAIIERLGF